LGSCAPFNSDRLLAKSSSSGSGRMQKGAVNVLGDWAEGLQQPNGLNCP
jgi:hypothetical protein